MNTAQSIRPGRPPLGILSSIVLMILCCPDARAQETAFLGLGDSLGESVQSADATYRTQIFGFLNLIAYQAGFTFTVPSIQSSPLGVIGYTIYRHRRYPMQHSSNLAVSGANVHTLLFEQADALDTAAIDSETDLVLFPRLGSQMEVAEAVQPDLAVCWIGNTDLLSAAIAFDQLDASQMTPLLDFEADFQEIALRLSQAADMAVFGNIPDVTDIAFLVDREDLLHFLGSDFGLAPGDYTSIVVMLLIKLGLDDGSLIADPAYVLDAGEVALIQDRTAAFNIIIQDTADGYGLPVVDVHGLFKSYKADPPAFLGKELSSRYLGGLFSLDGVHPSNLGSALIANAFIEKMNAHYSLGIPTFNNLTLLILFLTDPFVDKDGDGLVTGRFGQGLLETLAPFLGLSGDLNDLSAGASPGFFDPSEALKLIAWYIDFKGMKPDMESIREVFREFFGLGKLAGN